jgi:methylenetetrahydrofolate--tRNA-(uracil-5-)-methyltransferase
LLRSERELLRTAQTARQDEIRSKPKCCGASSCMRHELSRSPVSHFGTLADARPILLNRQLCLKAAPHIRFAGQITGCEGYVESSAVGLLAGMMVAVELAEAGLGGAAAHFGHGSAAGAHHGRCRGGRLPADERQFRPVSPGAKVDLGGYLTQLEAVPA